MSYDPRPNSGDTLSNTLNPIRTNFEVLEDRFDENHVELDGGSGGGKHKFLQMPEQSSAPTTAANEAALYTKVANSITELFMRREGNGNEIQLTTGEVVASSSGYTFLPGGLIMQWGIKVAPTKTGTVTFSTSNIAFPNNCFNVSLTQRRDGSDSTASMFLNGVPTKLKFDYNGSSASSAALYWVAIGN